jgi:putative endonuclease
MAGYTYIVSNDAHRLYIGATDNLPRRVYEHKKRLFPNAFTARYTYDRLVYFESIRIGRRGICSRAADQRLEADQEGRADSIRESAMARSIHVVDCVAAP